MAIHARIPRPPKDPPAVLVKKTNGAPPEGPSEWPDDLPPPLPDPPHEIPPEPPR